MGGLDWVGMFAAKCDGLLRLPLCWLVGAGFGFSIHSINPRTII